MTRANARLAVLVAALLAAPVAHAQLGIDLGGAKEKSERKDKGKKKKPDAKKKKPERHAPARPERHAPARPEPPKEEEAPPAPAPEPEVRPPPAAESAPAAPPEPPERPPESKPRHMPGLTLTPADPKAAAAAKARLDAAKKLLDERATETAALAFDSIVRDRSLAPAHDEARYLRAKALARLGLGHSALAAFDEILDHGPGATRFYQSSMEWLFYVGKGLKNEQPLMSRVVRYAGHGVPPAYEGRIDYLLAKYEFERGRALADAGRGQDARGAYAEARRLAAKVRPASAAASLGVAGADGKDGAPPGPDTGDAYARAKFVEGLVLFAQGDDPGAVEAFKDVVRLTNPKRNPKADRSLREVAFLQLARIHYQNRQNRYAIFYYDKMPWGGERWLEGLWEAAYAHYRIGNYEKALGNMLTLQSPYFKDEYFPESYVLKAIIYYENCRYPEARQVLDTFASLYDPVYQDLVKITGAQRNADATYELMRDAGQGGGMTRKILKLAYTDQNVQRLAESIAEIEAESDFGIGGRRPEFVESFLAKELKEKLRAERVSLVEEVAARARAKLEYERDQLRQLLASALRIQIEVSRKEREALEGSIAKGRQVDVVKDLKYSHAVSDEHLYWPYEGEFWRDELGTYSYTLTKGCKDRLPRPGATAGR
jgi:tetratricopeptide (TPR) repeat protein